MVRSADRPVVIVHGAFAGGWQAKPLQEALSRRGLDAYRPTLTGLGERVHLATPDVSLETHITDVVNVLEYEDLRDVVLVGHSYSGYVITGVADRVPNRVSHLVYLEAHIPEDGEAFIDVFDDEQRDRLLSQVRATGDGWRIYPWWPEPGRDTPVPIKAFTQPIELTGVGAGNTRGSLVLAGVDLPQSGQGGRIVGRAKQLGYSIHTVDSDHVGIISETRTVDLIADLAKVSGT